MQLMWVTYGGRAKRDKKFVENINDVLISLMCCVVEHRLKIVRGVDTYIKFDNRARGNTLMDYHNG